jgi:fatty acid desaturase
VGAAWLGSAMLAFAFDWLPHVPHQSRERWQHTRAVLFPKPIRGLMDQLLLGQSYHLIHHLYPRVPFFRYRAVFVRLRRYLDDNNAPVHEFGKH